MMFDQVEMETISAIVTTGVTCVSGYLVNFLRHKVGLAKLEKIKTFTETHQTLARTAVLFAQQAYSDFSGQAKKDVAIEFLDNELKNLGIPVEHTQLDGLIESSLKSAKSEFGDAWDNIPDTNATNSNPVTEESNNDITHLVEVNSLPQTGQPLTK